MKNIFNILSFIQQRYFLLAIFLIMFIYGCTDGSFTSMINLNPNPILEWQHISDGIEKQIFTKNTDGEEFLLEIYRIDQSVFKFEMAYLNKPMLLGLWQQKLAADVVINGGYFLEDYTPAGLFIINNKKVSTRMFDQDKSGLITIDNGKIYIRDLSLEPYLESEQHEFALQAYPFLIKNSKASFLVETGLNARRTMFGIDQNDKIYVIIARENNWTLFMLSNFLEKLPINFKYVINLDGGPSTGLVIKTNDYNLSIPSYLISNVIFANKKSD